MSADAPPPGGSEKDTARFSLRRLARTKPLPVLAIWLALCAWIGWTVSDRGVVASGDLDGLTPVEHRLGSDASFVLVSIDPTGPHTSEDLRVAVDRLHDHFGEDWWPIAPPAAEVSGWLDAHALYLLPVEAHGKLVERLGDESISASVESLRARLSSPFFGMTGQDARRDPLRLRDLAREAATDLAPARRGADLGADVTPAGDLITRDGTAVLLMLRRNVEVDALESEVASVLGEGGITGVVVGPRRAAADAKRLVEENLPRILAIALAGIAVVLAIALRKLGPALAILVCLASGVGLVAAVMPIDAIAFPLLVLLAGFGCEGSLHLQRISDRGWPAALVLGTALAALALSPYPLWMQWSWMWLLAMLAVLVMLRVALPAILAVLRSSADWPARGFLLKPMPLVAVVVSAAALGAGAFAADRVEVRGAERIDLGSRVQSPEQSRLLDEFFDPALIARVPTHGEDRIDALTNSANDARVLESLVPQEATRVDSPGSLVLPQDELHRRNVALANLDLPERLDKLGEMLENRGFRPAAFGEFLRAASDPGRAPSPGAALDGPLSRWVERYVEGESPDVTLYSEVHLTSDPEVVPPVLETQTRRLEFYGPAVAARLDARSLRDWVGIYALSQLWICALLVWLGTRSFAISISAAVAALVTETATLALMIPAGIPLTPMVVPVLLLSGAAAAIAAGRACRAVDLQRPLFAMGLLVTSACQVVAGLALAASDVPLWTQVGYVAAIGGAAASGAGLFIAPGLTRLLRGIGGKREA